MSPFITPSSLALLVNSQISQLVTYQSPPVVQIWSHIGQKNNTATAGQEVPGRESTGISGLHKSRFFVEAGQF